MDQELSQTGRLAALAAGIRAEHQATAASLRRGLEHAMAAGELLIEARALLKHGEWLPWLRDHCALSDRTARLYTRLARNRPEIERQIGNVADLSVRGAVALIATPNETGLANFAPKIVDAALDDLEFADYERAKVCRETRRAAFIAINGVLSTLIELADKQAQLAADVAWAMLGEQLMSAIGDCKNLLLAEDPQRATAAIVRANDVAAEMLKQVEATRDGGGRKSATISLGPAS
jgi:Protein of unknown function (DUF3102)